MRKNRKIIIGVVLICVGLFWGAMGGFIYAIVGRAYFKVR